MSVCLIDIDTFSDERGSIEFCNEFDMSAVIRFYKVTHADTETVRAWQLHYKEHKWFVCTAGSFDFRLVPLTDVDCQLLLALGFVKQGDSYSINLTSKVSQVVFVPAGFANGFRALERNSSLTVYSNLSLAEAKLDNDRAEVGAYFEKWL
jgi:dTDP-4-dehydrorhamnose 3,5-epimerase-like enzyme